MWPLQGSPAGRGGTDMAGGGISRPRPIPARSSPPAKSTATRRISTTRGRSPTHSAAWESRRSTPTARAIAWAEVLRTELIRRQRDDGTWANRFTASKEDDPFVATPFAAGALGICRTFLDRCITIADPIPGREAIRMSETWTPLRVNRDRNRALARADRPRIASSVRPRQRWNCRATPARRLALSSPSPFRLASMLCLEVGVASRNFLTKFDK